jgi:hypothetical protein
MHMVGRAFVVFAAGVIESVPRVLVARIVIGPLEGRMSGRLGGEDRDPQRE